MSDTGREAVAGPGPVRIVTGRRLAETAPARCLCYAAFSELLASPHEVDPRPAVRQRLGAGSGLPYAVGLDAVLREVAAAGLRQLQAEYSGLFEVGSEGPPVPIREDLQTGQRASTREEIVRFYDYFGYALGDRFAWQPDHLSIELEFMHYLCFREAEGGPDVQSFQLAQADFCERHPGRWVPRFAAAVDRLAAGSLYARVTAALATFLAGDLQWQLGTISPAAVAAAAPGPA